MAGINIALVSDVRDFLRGTRSAEAGLEAVADSLDDVARDGADSSDRLERTFRAAFDAVRDASQDTGREVAKNIDDGAEEAGEGLGSLKDEAQGTATEVAASFSGSAEDIAGGFQELAANAFAGFGPAGAAAGIAAAAGIGLLFARVQEDAAKTEARVQAMYDDMLESGANYLSEELLQQRISDIVQGTEDAITTLGTAQEAAELLGVDLETALAAYAGSQPAAEAMLAALEEQRRVAAEASREGGESAANRLTELNEIQAALQSGQEELGITAAQTDLVHRSTQKWTEEAATARDRLSEARTQYSGLDSKTITITAEADLSAFDRAIRNYHPVVVGTFRAGNAVV